MENATAAELYTQAYRQWREVVELDLQDSEDIVYGIMPLLIQGLGLDPDHLPSLDLLSDMLMEIGAYDEALSSRRKYAIWHRTTPNFRKSWPRSRTTRTTGGASPGPICIRSACG